MGTRHKPFDDDHDARPSAIESAYHDPQVGTLVAAGTLDAARQHLLARLRGTGPNGEPYLDLIRLERSHDNVVWQRWVMRGLASCPDFAPRLFASLPEEALRDCAHQQHMPWHSLRGQRDRGAARHLFALFVGALLWQGEVEDAFTAVGTHALREDAEHDPVLRTLMIAVLAALAWRDGGRIRAAAPALGVSLPEPDPDAPPPYPMDALEHALLLGDALRRASDKAPCPAELARAIELGPFFGGDHARALLDQLSAELRERPDEALRFCDAVVETSSALGVYLGEAIAELAHETPGLEATAPPDGRAQRAIEELARSERRRRLAAALMGVAGLASGALFSARGKLELAVGLAAPFVLGAWALLGFVRDLAYVPRVRPALARALLRGRQDLASVRDALEGRAELAWVARRLEREPGLWLLGALGARSAPPTATDERPTRT